MASSQSIRLPSMMADALSCCICLLPYDLEDRLPKVFPCQHTVCLSCAGELSQKHLDAAIPCPTCRQPVTVPAKGVIGLQTNLDVRNIVEIIQRTKTCSVAKPNCPEHPSVPVSNACMQCKMFLCTKCFTSSTIRDHVDHPILEVKEAFEVLKEKCDALVKKWKETSAALQAKSSKINDSTTALLDAVNSKSLDVFAMMDEYSTMITTISITPDQTEPNVTEAHGIDSKKLSDGHGIGTKKLHDGSCTARALERSLGYLKNGSANLVSMSRAHSSNSIVRTKMAAVALQVEVLHFQLGGKMTEKLSNTLSFLWNLTDESEPCCTRFVLLGGVDLLLTCFEQFILKADVVCKVLNICGNLSEHEVLHKDLLTTTAVNMLMYVLHNFTMRQKHLPERSCRILSLLLSSSSTPWPRDCLSKDQASALVMETVKQFNLIEVMEGNYNSLVPQITLLTQKVSKAAKYWAIWSLNSLTSRETRYCTMLVHDGGIPVLKQQQHADEFVQKLSKQILNRIT